MPPKAAKKSAAPLNTALFVLKGAVATVLNRLTVTVSASNNKLVIVAKEMLTDDQIAKILQLANDKVKENAPVSFEDLERAVAEEKYKDKVLNNCPLHDLKGVPKHFSRVGVIQIPNFVLGVSGAPHVATTGEIGTISIVETTFNSAKETLQFTIDVAEPESSSSAAATTATKATNSSNNNANNNDNAKRQLPPMSTNVPHFAQQLVDIALPHIDNDAARAAARAAALKQFENELYLFKNAAYAAGLLSTRK